MSFNGGQAKFFPALKNAMLPKGTFKDRVALITGGGTGLGKSMALTLSALGASVAILGRRLNVLEETSKEISSITGNEAVPISADVRDPNLVKDAVDTIEKKLGLPTIIVNNAAGNFISPTERISPNAFKTIVDIVLNGTANVTLDVGKRLINANKGASFLAITTTYTFRGSGYVVASASAKAGVEALVRSLASEWGQYGIRLNCIAPGGISTEGAWSRLDPTNQFKEMAINRIPVGRLGEPEELANLASYLLSDYGNWITGETVVLDGGEIGFMAGQFNGLLNRFTKEQWDQIEQIIRATNAKDKKNRE